MREVRDSGSKMTTVADYLLQRGSSRMLTRHRRGERTNPAAMVVDREELGAHPDEINYDLPLGTEIRTQAGQTDTQITAKFLTGRPGPGGWMKPFSISTNNQIFPNILRVEFTTWPRLAH